MEQSPGPAMEPPTASAYVIVAIVFILSGATGLAYEVVWTRQLTTFFGSTLYGVATVLTAFMGGLALGSYLLGRQADRVERPLVIYGLLEIGISIAALLFPLALDVMQPIIGKFYVTGGENTFYVFSLVRFVVVFLLLLVPTTLMGATLPVLAKAVTREFAQVGRRIGGLYALNTGGAVLGVFFTGFFLLEALGIFRVTLLAVVIDIIIGVACIVMGQKMFRVSPSVAAPESAMPAAGSAGDELSAGMIRLVLATYLVSGFVALAYQVCWTRALIFSFDSLKSTTYSFSGMLVVFLLGLTLGSALMQAIVDRQENLLRLYALIQAGIGLSGGLSFFVILANLPTLNEIGPDGALIYWAAVTNVMMKTAAAIGIPTLLMGMAFPVVARLVVRSMRHLSLDVARVYALNTVGAILGSFCSGFILIPLLGITGTITLLAFVNLSVAAILFLLNGRLDQRTRMIFAIGAGAAAVLVPIRIGFSEHQLQRIQRNETFVHYEEGAMATISVVENNSGDRMIYVDDVGVAGTDKIMLTDQKSLAHVPMMLLGGQATNVLTVGFGSGGASYSYTLYPSIENIHAIEIAPEVLRAAPALTDSNHGILVTDKVLAAARGAGASGITGFRHPISEYVHTPLPGFKSFDPRYRVLVDDARSYLRFNTTKYDVIATDCTDLRYKSNANLYDLQYFELCRESISDRGLVVVWMPLAGLSDRAFRVALRTFQQVFPTMSVWYFTNQPTHYCLLIGARDRMNIDYADVVKATAMPGVAEDLEEIGLRDPDKLISSFVCDERTLTQHLAGFPLNTEDWPIIEFESPRFGYDSRPLRDNQEALFRIQTPATPLLTNLPADGDPSDRIWLLQQANYVVFKGHSEYRLYNNKDACRHYMEALAMVPFDESIRRLLDFEELRRHYETSKARPTANTIVTAQGLAEVYLMQGRYRDSVTIAEEMVGAAEGLSKMTGGDGNIRSMTFGLLAVLAESYARSKVPRKAEEYLERARGYAKDESEFDTLRRTVEGAAAAAPPSS